MRPRTPSLDTTFCAPKHVQASLHKTRRSYFRRVAHHRPSVSRKHSESALRMEGSASMRRARVSRSKNSSAGPRFLPLVLQHAHWVQGLERSGSVQSGSTGRTKSIGASNLAGQPKASQRGASLQSRFLLRLLSGRALKNRRAALFNARGQRPQAQLHVELQRVPRRVEGQAPHRDGHHEPPHHQARRLEDCSGSAFYSHGDNETINM